LARLVLRLALSSFFRRVPHLILALSEDELDYRWLFVVYAVPALPLSLGRIG
jgi:hypothetical protein